MDSYKLNLGDMTIHFVANFPMRKKPVLAVSFEGEACMYKVASFNDYKEMKWFVECLNDALERRNVRMFSEQDK